MSILYATVAEIGPLRHKLNNPNKLETMQKNTNILAKKHSTENICNICLNGKENIND